MRLKAGIESELQQAGLPAEPRPYLQQWALSLTLRDAVTIS
jgi:hypothetical protein